MKLTYILEMKNTGTDRSALQHPELSGPAKHGLQRTIAGGHESQGVPPDSFG